MLIDTPGMRELQPWGDESSVAAAFDDIAALAAGCRFTDCAHDREPGCAVRAAVDAGRLDADRLENFHRLGREAAYEAQKARQGGGRRTQTPMEAAAPGGQGDVPRPRSRIICRHANGAGGSDCVSAALWRWAACRSSAPQRPPGHLPGPPRHDERTDRHRGASRLGPARRRSFPRARDRRATSTTTASSASSKGSGRSSASTAIRRWPSDGGPGPSPTIRARSPTCAAWWRSRSPSRMRGRRRSTLR